MTTVPNVDPATGVPLFHAYAGDGSYDLTVEVVDSDGGVGIATTRVLIPAPSKQVLGLAALLTLVALRRRGRCEI
jgi:hypothetical protein